MTLCCHNIVCTCINLCGQHFHSKKYYNNCTETIEWDRKLLHYGVMIFTCSSSTCDGTFLHADDIYMHVATFIKGHRKSGVISIKHSTDVTNRISPLTVVPVTATRDGIYMQHAVHVMVFTCSMQYM